MKKGFLIIVLLLFLKCFAIGQDSNTTYPPATEDFFFIDKELLDSGGVFTIWGIYFQLGMRDLVDSNDVRILALAAYLIQHPTYIIELSTHRDCRGSGLSGRRLTYIRAQSIVDRLVELGVNTNQLIAQSYGESKPYNDNGILLACDYIAQFSRQESEAVHQKNRRVEIRVLTKDYVTD